MLTQAPARTCTRTLDATPADVFRAFTRPMALRDWLCHAAEVEPRVGGRYYLWWNDGYGTSGAITDLVAGERLAFTWQGPGERPGAVRIELQPDDGRTTVTVTHDGDDADAAAARLGAAALENLQALVETGIDMRLARRPMLGLSGADDLGAARAAALGLPVTEGLWVGGVVEGLGAHAAGLQKDDVVVRMGDQPIRDQASFVEVVQTYEAGDRVPVVFYRGPAQQTVTLELGRRPMPVVPDDGATLAAALRATYATLDAELAAALAGVDEARADYQPTPDAWNIKRVLSHLIAIERDNHAWITVVSEDGEIEYPFHDNDAPRIAAFAEIYGTLDNLLLELHRSQEATLAMLTRLTPAVLRRKHLLSPLIGWLDNLAIHSREHIAEIAALAAASATA
jgi:uncharacterized protein YndB with AHSA1/START domain